MSYEAGQYIAFTLGRELLLSGPVVEVDNNVLVVAAAFGITCIIDNSRAVAAPSSIAQRARKIREIQASYLRDQGYLSDTNVVLIDADLCQTNQTLLNVIKEVGTTNDRGVYAVDATLVQSLSFAPGSGHGGVKPGYFRTVDNTVLGKIFGGILGGVGGTAIALKLIIVTGKVVSYSAAGITSGLAALGGPYGMLGGVAMCCGIVGACITVGAVLCWFAAKKYKEWRTRKTFREFVERAQNRGYVYVFVGLTV